MVNIEEKIHTNLDKTKINPEDSNSSLDETKIANKEAEDKTIDSSLDKILNNTVGILQDHLEAGIKEV